MKMFLMYNIFAVFLNCVHYFFQNIKMMQYPDSCLVLIYHSLIYYKSHYGCTRNAVNICIMRWELPFFFFPKFAQRQRFHPSWYFLATCHSFTYVEYMYDICLPGCFRISVAEIHCIPCVLGIAFLRFRYRKSSRARSRGLFLHTTYVCSYMHITQVYVYT